jgi:hypothetical protein
MHDSTDYSESAPYSFGPESATRAHERDRQVHTQGDSYVERDRRSAVHAKAETPVCSICKQSHVSTAGQPPTATCSQAGPLCKNHGEPPCWSRPLIASPLPSVAPVLIPRCPPKHTQHLRALQGRRIGCSQPQTSLAAIAAPAAVAQGTTAAWRKPWRCGE